MCQLLSHMLRRQVSDTADCTDVHVAGATKRAHMRPHHVHGRVKDSAQVAGSLTEGDAGVADLNGRQ